MLDAQRSRLLCAASFIVGAAVALLTLGLTRSLTHRPTSVSTFGGQLPPPGGQPAGIPPSGRIEAVEVPLANADGAFPDRAQRLANTRWLFDNISPNRLARFFSSCGLRPAEQRMLLDKATWQIRSNDIAVFPSEQLIWSLSPQSRAQIYEVLSKNPENFPQCFPFRFPSDTFEHRFANSDLPVSDIEKIRRLTYTNSGYICFTDLEAVKTVFKDEEFKDLIETLYQMPTYILRLRVSPDSDVEALVKYWGRGGRERIISPLLNSLAKVPGGSGLNIAYFLPPFARLRLYTYPYSWNDRSMSRQDCFFTSMNFFNATPDTNFLDRAYTARVLASDYIRIQQAPCFGDVVALSNANGEIFHTCVYVADDFVFTKNGADAEQPWVLMKLPDMLMLYYPIDRSGHLSFLRRKDMTLAGETQQASARGTQF